MQIGNDLYLNSNPHDRGGWHGRIKLNEMDNSEQLKTKNKIVLRPTMILRIDSCKRRNNFGELQQLWVDDVNYKKQWIPVPIIASGTLDYEK